MTRFAVLLFIALFAVSAAVPTFDMPSPARQRQMNKLTARRRALQKQVINADNMLQKLTRDRQVAEIQLKTTSRKLNFATDECSKGNGKCDQVTGLETAVNEAEGQLNYVKRALQEATKPEVLKQRRNELADVTEQLGVLSKMLFPKPSVVARPIRD